MQRAFINCIYDLAEKNPNVVFLTADNGTDFDSFFARAFPDQYYNSVSYTHLNGESLASRRGFLGYGIGDHQSLGKRL